MTRIDVPRALAEPLARTLESRPSADSIRSQHGESLADVARRTGFPEAALRDANPGLTPFDALPADSQVAMPAPANDAAADAQPGASGASPVNDAAAQPGASGTTAGSPRDTLDAIEALPEPNIRDLPPQLPDDEKQQILQSRQDAHDARVLQMAESALAAAEPPQLSDYSALPPATARAEYEMAMAQYNGDVAALQAQVLEIRVRQLEASPEFRALPADTRDAVIAAMRNGDYTITGVSTVENHPFHSGTADAVRFDVTIDGETTPVYLPVETDPALDYHGLDEVAAGLASMPAEARNEIERIDVNADRNPEDAHWEVEYNSPGFRSYMTAGAEGVVSIYPMPPEDAQTQDWLNGSLLHEVGHIVSLRDFSDEDWANWSTAAASDGDVVSDYATNSPLEDFAETYKLYLSVIGTADEAAARERFPARFDFLDDLMAQG